MDKISETLQNQTHAFLEKSIGKKAKEKQQIM